MSDGEKKYTIRLDVDPAGARRGADVAKEEFRKIEASAEKLRDARGRFAKQAGDAEATAAKKSADAQVKAHGQVGASIDNVGTAVAGLVTRYAGLSVAVGYVNALAQVGKQSADYYGELARKVLATKDALRALASVVGERADNKFVLQNARFEAQTGFRPDESRAFREAFSGSGAQFRDRNINATQYAKFEGLAGSFTAANGLESDAVGKYAGGMLGFTDFNRFGDQAGNEALGRLSRGVKILQRGSGDNNVLVRQAAMLRAATQNEDELRGTFTSDDELATAISVGAEYHDASSAELNRAFIRGIRGFDKKQGDVLGASGIGKTESPFSAAQKLSDYLDREVVAKGGNVGNFIRENFDDELTQNAVATYVNRGVKGGVIADRLKYADEVGGRDKALADLQALQDDPNGPIPYRRAEAQKRLVEGAKGIPRARVSVLETQAEAELLNEKKIDTYRTNLEDTQSDRLDPAAYLGMTAPARQRRIDARIEAIIRRRTPAGVSVQLPGDPGQEFHSLPDGELRTRYYDNAARAIEKGGGNAFIDIEPVVKELQGLRQDGRDAKKAALPAGPPSGRGR